MQLSLKKNDLKIGDELFEELPPVDFGRIAAHQQDKS